MRNKSVTFADRPSDGPYAHYDSHRAYADSANDEGLCRIIRDNLDVWIDGLANSHGEFGKRVAANAPAWNYSRLSRLDARPWGNASIIKPLFFARAVVEWFDQNSNAEKLTLIGAPEAVGRYLSACDLSPKLRVEGYEPAPVPIRWASGRDRLWRRIAKLASCHLTWARPDFASKRTLVVYQHLSGQDLDNGYRFYFTSLLDEVPDDRIAIGTLGIQPQQRSGSRAKPILDAVSPRDLVAGLNAVFKLDRTVRAVLKSECSCTIAGRQFAGFWKDYANQLMDLDEVFEAAVTCACLERIGSQSEIQTIVYPYEEKGIERAMLNAAAKTSWRTVGFTPHPQHRLNVAMKDRDGDNCPKPASYAFCGRNYIPMFRKWGQKDGAEMAVWGSAKSFSGQFDPRFDNTGRPLRVLFAASHPVEIKMLHAWFDARPQLFKKATFNVRRYRATGPTVFDRPMQELITAHPDVTETERSLDNDLAHCDVVLFCGTSAGPEAVNKGRLAIYADLNDVFPINPMFDDVSDMLPCHDDEDLLTRIEELRQMSNADQQRLYERQRAAATRCFNPIDRTAISEEFP